MRYKSLEEFQKNSAKILAKGPIAIILAEDAIEIGSTVEHHLKNGFRAVILLAHHEIPLLPEIEDQIHRIDYTVTQTATYINAVNKIAGFAPPQTWFYYCFNAEYLFFPFCESRTIGDMLTFHTEERRDAMFTYVIDLYPKDLSVAPNGVSLADAHMDRLGYYALAREDANNNWKKKERQIDCYGGLRWRFEEYVSWTKRRIDRIAIFKSKPGLELHDDFTFNDEEYNTYSCPWHHNLTAVVCSFRAAKGLKSNPGSRSHINNFHWHNSVPFEWNSQQLMNLGLMEPGQWL